MGSRLFPRGWGILTLLFFLLSGCKGFEESIIDRPIVFDEVRKELSLLYLKEHYGIVQEQPVIKPEMVVVHWTYIPDLETSFEVFEPSLLGNGRTDIQGGGALNVSAHYLVDRDGTAYRLMPDSLMARHVIGLNYSAIGIENVGGTPDKPLTKEQLRTNIRLIRYLQGIHRIRHVIGHYEYPDFEGHPLWKEKDTAYRTEKDDPGKDFMEAIRRRIHIKQE